MSYKILQLSDTHLFKSTEDRLFSVLANSRFTQVLSFIEKNQLTFDSIFLTGDMSQDETITSYEILANHLSYFEKNVYWIAGNHDDIAKAHAVFENYPLFHYIDQWVLDSIGWKFLFIDSVLKDSDSGYLTDAALEKLTKDLKSTPEFMSVAVIMHHHPFAVNTPLVDQFSLKNGEEFSAALAKSKRKIDLVICGHVHENYDLVKGNIRLISSPATCLQWKKGTETMIIRDVGGFNMWTFSENGKFEYQTYFV